MNNVEMTKNEELMLWFEIVKGKVVYWKHINEYIVPQKMINSDKTHKMVMSYVECDIEGYRKNNEGLITNINLDDFILMHKNSRVCECGAWKVSSSYHSDWCNSYKVNFDTVD